MKTTIVYARSWEDSFNSAVRKEAENAAVSFKEMPGRTVRVDLQLVPAVLLSSSSN